MAPALDHDHTDDEMHELNQEADYLDQTVTIEHNGVNGSHKHRQNSSSDDDPDAQAQVIASLRGQIQDLFGQVTQLNNKLVHSYDRVSDLEDELHVASSNLRNATVKVSQLELERSEHLSALSTGLLVEKANVTSELTRLMERATEEAARAGEAESARVAIEKDLDDLSAGLFDQANTMVAEARLARARSEKKVEETEVALRGAEEIVGILQTQLQTLQSEKEDADRKVQDMRVLMGKGKWIERPASQSGSTSVRLLCLHSPYLEYLQFIAHLRSIRPSMQHPPAMATLLPLPFLARLITEDSDPTVRLDLAPSLNWLTRRSVLSAIHGGQLTVEPMATGTLLEELSPLAIPGHAHVVCALCGTPILDPPTSPTRASPMMVSSPRPVSQNKTSWGPSFLKTSLVQTISAVPFGHSSSRPETPTTPAEAPSQIYIFKLETTSSSGLPVPQGNQAKPATIYPLCSSGWCLARLRTTCSLWAFVRTGIVERIWDDEPYVPPSNNNSPRVLGESTEAPPTPPPETPRRSRIGIGSLWGSMSRSLSNSTKPELPEKSVPTEIGSPKSPEIPKKDVPVLPRRLPPPPPRHPPLPPSEPSVDQSTSQPPPLPARSTGPPPPLPRRNRPVPPPPPRRAPISETTANDNEVTGADVKLEDVATEPEDTMPTAHDDSHEDFATPSEEIAALHSRPMSPATVPLPASEPSSPLLEPADAHPENTEGEERIATPPPIQLDEDDAVEPDGEAHASAPEAVSTTLNAETEPVSTPVAEQSDAPILSESAPANEPAAESADAPAFPPLAPVPSVEADTAPAPSAPASGAPPPLPRRAANRGRPPAPPPVAAPAVEPESSSPSEQKVPEADIETAVEHPVPEIITSEPSSPPAYNTDALQDYSADGLADDDRHSGELVSLSPGALSDTTPADHSEAASLRSDVDVEDATSEVNLSHNEEGEQEVEIEEEEEEPQEVDDGIYVGEATWEERTWKQLVRLRENMFWARIGSVR